MTVALSRVAPFRTGLASIPVLRALALPLLRLADRPVTVKHAYTGQPLHLRSYTDKGYWYYGKAREAATMRRIRDIVRPGDTVIEAGGRIGYFTQFLSGLVGQAGEVHVFAPGCDNTQYLTRNIGPLGNTLHIKAELSATETSRGVAEDDIGRFMNAGTKYLGVTQRTCAAMRLDDYTLRHSVIPHFLKIDVNGSELDVLSGAEGTLPQTPALMIAVKQDRDAVFTLLCDHQFALSDENGKAITTPEQMRGNVFGERKRRLRDCAQP